MIDAKSGTNREHRSPKASSLHSPSETSIVLKSPVVGFGRGSGGAELSNGVQEGKREPQTNNRQLSPEFGSHFLSRVVPPLTTLARSSAAPPPYLVTKRATLARTLRTATCLWWSALSSCWVGGGVGFSGKAG